MAKAQKSHASSRRQPASRRTRPGEANLPERKRYPIEKEPQPFLSTAEARAEAAYMAMQALLPLIPQSLCKSIMAHCYKECDTLDIAAITEEAECLFTNVRFEPPTR